ncbi:hypothetical protein BGX23_011688 [Mortierella sp. AD031]|nr:hypothetical protein BGX23_011688 [Mortierella sp. AD031]
MESDDDDDDEEILKMEAVTAEEIANFGGRRRKDGVPQASGKGLQKLAALHSDYLIGPELHSILHQGNSLRSLEFEDHYAINASDVVSSPWSCKWLTSLKIKIAGIPQPYVQRD